MTIRKLAHHEIKSGRPAWRDLDQKPRLPVTVIADNIRSLHNVGSIFRSADAAGVEKLILTGITPVPPRKEISKTALGSEESVAWEYHADVLETVQYFRERHLPVVALEHTSASKDFQLFQYTFPLCVIIGNEVEGVSDAVIRLADAAVDIPMFGTKQSLNVSVACGVLLFELARQWKIIF